LVADRVVASLARPGGNVTGISIMLVELNEKRLDLLSDIVPQARGFALLMNPSTTEKRATVDLQAAAQAKGLWLDILSAVTESDIDAAFSNFDQRREDGLVVAGDPFFNSRRERLVALASQHRVPAIYEWREVATAGGLISYGPSQTDLFRQVGVSVGGVLAGAKPADLRIEQPTKFELVINMKAATALGLAVPQSMLARADEVIK